MTQQPDEPPEGLPSPGLPVEGPPPDWRIPYAPPPGWQPPPTPSGAPPGWQPPPYGAPAGQQPYGWPPAYPQPRNTNGFAIASLVCSLLGIVVPFVGGILGIVFGIVGLQGVRQQREAGRGLAISGIVIGALDLLLWTIALVGVMATGSSSSGGPVV